MIKVMSNTKQFPYGRIELDPDCLWAVFYTTDKRFDYVIFASVFDSLEKAQLYATRIYKEGVRHLMMDESCIDEIFVTPISKNDDDYMCGWTRRMCSMFNYFTIPS